MRWPLVLIHGYPFDHSLWDNVQKELAGKVKVIAPDLPGFGGTSVLKTEPSLDRYADFIAELLDKENISTAVVAGMSMGGYVALSFAENYPDRLAGLALVATQAAADTEEARKGRAAMIEKVKAAGPGVAAEAITPKLFAENKLPDETLEKYPQQGAAMAGVEGITWALKAMASRPDRAFVLRNLECPALVLHGNEDKLVPCEKAELMAQEAKGAKFLKIKGAGHALPIEAPKIVAEELLALVQQAELFQSHKHVNRPPVTFAPTDKGKL